MEPFLASFPWGTPAFARLRDETRRRVLEEAVTAELPGLVITYALAFDLADDLAYLDALVAPVAAAGWQVDVVELRADLVTRVGREGGTDRIAAKPSKADVEWARTHLGEMDEHRWHSDGEHVGPGRHVVLDNAHGDPAATAREAVRILGLPDVRPSAAS